MPSPIYQYVINQVVNLPIRMGPDVLMNVPVWEHCALQKRFLDVEKFTVQTHYRYYYDVDSSSQLYVIKYTQPQFSIKIS